MLLGKVKMERLKAWKEGIKIEFEMRNVITKIGYFSKKISRFTVQRKDSVS